MTFQTFQCFQETGRWFERKEKLSVISFPSEHLDFQPEYFLIPKGFDEEECALAINEQAQSYAWINGNYRSWGNIVASSKGPLIFFIYNCEPTLKDMEDKKRKRKRKIEEIEEREINITC